MTASRCAVASFLQVTRMRKVSTILEGLDLLRAFQHFMLHGATLHLLVVTVLTIQPKDLTGPISPSGL